MTDTTETQRPITRKYNSEAMQFVHKTYFKGPWKHIFILMWHSNDAFDRIDPKVEQWCLDRWGKCGRLLNDGVNVWYRDLPGSYAFMHDDEAMEFKMRWCGAND